MALGEEIRGHLPYLRRYARALTGSQQHGDNFVRAALETIVAAPDEFDTSHSTRVELYRIFHRIWESAHIEDGEPEISNNPSEAAAQARLANITPLGRQMLLLTALEGFGDGDTAMITGTDGETVDRLLSDAVESLERETRTSVLIIEDEPLIAIELEQIVRDMGHDIVGTAATHRDALAAVERHRPGLVLADIQLADGSSGIDAVRDILATCPVPVIFITAFPERLLTGEHSEPAFLISKPFRPNAVRAAISQSLFFAPMKIAA